MYEKLENAGEIMENNGVQTFNFSDPEGNYFVIGKLWHLSKNQLGKIL